MAYNVTWSDEPSEEILEARRRVASVLADAGVDPKRVDHTWEAMGPDWAVETDTPWEINIAVSGGPGMRVRAALADCLFGVIHRLLPFRLRVTTEFVTPPNGNKMSAVRDE